MEMTVVRGVCVGGAYIGTRSGGWLAPDKPFNHWRLHGCHFLFGQVSGSKRNQRTFPMSIHSLLWHLHTEMKLMHEKMERETERERGKKKTAAEQCMHTQCTHACMDAIAVAQDINQSALFNRDMAGGDTHQMNQCPSIGGRSNSANSCWFLQKQGGQLDTFPKSLRSTWKAFRKGSRYLKGDWPKYLLCPRGSI